MDFTLRVKKKKFWGKKWENNLVAGIYFDYVLKGFILQLMIIIKTRFICRSNVNCFKDGYEGKLENHIVPSSGKRNCEKVQLY